MIELILDFLASPFVLMLSAAGVVACAVVSYIERRP